MKAEIIARLEDLHACEEAIKWAKGKRTPESAWDSCKRGDWMLWLIGRVDGGKPWSEQRKRLVLAACKCVQLSLKYVPALLSMEGQWPLQVAELMEKWASRKRVKRKDLIWAAHAGHPAYVASMVARTADAVYMADTVARAARATYATDVAILKQCADIVRKHYPEPPEV